MLISLCTVASGIGRAQCYTAPDTIGTHPFLGLGAVYESRHGWNMPATGTVRALVVLAEFEYQAGYEHLDPDLLGTPGWPVGQLPKWVDHVDPA